MDRERSGIQGCEEIDRAVAETMYDSVHIAGHAFERQRFVH